MTDYTTMRQAMVESQLETNRIVDPMLLEAYRSVPREMFVPEHRRGIAYVDEDIALSDTRFLMEPMIEARLIQNADMTAQSSVLVLGGATGHMAAIISYLTETVWAVESDMTCFTQAQSVIAALKIAHVTMIKGDIRLGLPQHAPYDVIILNGSAVSVPDAILQQLTKTGRLLGIIKPEGVPVGEAVLMTRSGYGFATKVLFDAQCPYLPEFAPVSRFIFQ